MAICLLFHTIYSEFRLGGEMSEDSHCPKRRYTVEDCPKIWRRLQSAKKYEHPFIESGPNNARNEN